MNSTRIKDAVACAVLALPMTAAAGEAQLGPVSAKYTLTGSYAAAWRLQNPDNGIIDAPVRPSVPVSDDLKYPESNNFDDGDRNFLQYDLVNNRASLLGDLELSWGEFGLLARGDIFYDAVYFDHNRHDAPDRINTTQQPIDTFTHDAREFSGYRARMLDAYAYFIHDFDNGMGLQLKVGRHIAAWGQSLFFNGVALTQSRADSTRSTVPGADVKSILLPTNQISMRFSLTDRWTLLGQYQLEFKPFEIDPVGSFFSPADLVGPGREFAYGLKNPFYLDNLSGIDLSDPGDIAGLLQTINSAFDGVAMTGPIEAFLNALPALELGLSLPGTGNNALGAPEGLHPVYAGDIEPDREDKQYGVGLTFALTDITELGAYYLKYHQKTPAVLLNFGSLDLISAQEIGGIPIPALTTAHIGLKVPESYNILYFDNVDLYAVGFSTVIGGVNVGGEVIRREGVDVLVDVDQGVNGPVPTPTRATTNQVLVNGIYSFRPPWVFDTITMVGEFGWINAEDVTPVQSVEGADAGSYYDQLSFGDEAWAIATLFYLDKTNLMPGLDLRIPLSYQQALKGRSPLSGGFGSLFDENDIRIGAGAEFTWLQQFTVGVSYSGFLGGRGHFLKRPLQDRDTIGVSLRYNIL